jgi:uncharacterized protein (TIGR03435 family)
MQFELAACKSGFTKMRPSNAAGLLAILALFVVPFPGAAQISEPPREANPAAALPRFDVASIRPSGAGQRELNGLYTYPGGRIVCKGCMLEYLVAWAFDLQTYQISGGPPWMRDFGSRFDIQAEWTSKTPSTAWTPASIKLPPKQEQREMLQSLLIDRFQFQYRRETREGTVYLLTKGSKKLKLHAPEDPNAFPWAGGISGGWFGGGIRGENISMAQLATRISRFVERPVFDRTGLAGSFDFEYATGDQDNDSDKTGFLIQAMKEIGLDLKSAKGPVETLEILHAEKPSEN